MSLLSVALSACSPLVASEEDSSASAGGTGTETSTQGGVSTTGSGITTDATTGDKMTDPKGESSTTGWGGHGDLDINPFPDFGRLDLPSLPDLPVGPGCEIFIEPVEAPEDACPEGIDDSELGYVRACDEPEPGETCDDVAARIVGTLGCEIDRECQPISVGSVQCEVEGISPVECCHVFAVTDVAPPCPIAE